MKISLPCKFISHIASPAIWFYLTSNPCPRTIHNSPTRNAVAFLFGSDPISKWIHIASTKHFLKESSSILSNASILILDLKVGYISLQLFSIYYSFTNTMFVCADTSYNFYIIQKFESLFLYKTYIFHLLEQESFLKSSNSISPSFISLIVLFLNKCPTIILL